MIQIPSYKKMVFLPHSEYRLISQLYQLCIEGTYYILYKKYFDNNKNKFMDNDSNWYILTLNAYYDLAISHWCNVFGAYSEPTHYTRLIQMEVLKTKLEECVIQPATAQTLKDKILQTAKVSPSVYDDYHRKTKEYRDRGLIHYENSPDIINDGDISYPCLRIADDTFCALLLILIEVIKKFPKEKSTVNSYGLIYDDVNNSNEIKAILQKSLPDLSKF